MSYQKHGFTFNNPAQANKYFGENPIREEPTLIFRSHQAAWKWLPKNLDLIKDRAGEIEALRHLAGRLKYYTVSITRADKSVEHLARDKDGHYYWSKKWDDTTQDPTTPSNPESESMEQEYIVKVKWTTYGEARIKASSPEEAMDKFIEADTIPDPENETGQEDMTAISAVPASDEMEDGA